MKAVCVFFPVEVPCTVLWLHGCCVQLLEMAPEMEDVNGAGLKLMMLASRWRKAFENGKRQWASTRGATRPNWPPKSKATKISLGILPAPSKGCQINPTGWFNWHPLKPFGTLWKVQVHEFHSFFAQLVFFESPNLAIWKLERTFGRFSRSTDGNQKSGDQFTSWYGKLSR